MSALDLGTLFVLGLLGSTHCLAMCSAFVLCVGQRSHTASVSYQVGRVVAYATIGALLGWFGAELRESWDASMGHAVLVVAGGLMIVLGLVQGGSIHMPALGGARFQHLLGRVLRVRSLLGPAGLGLLTGALPCPLLYAALVRSAVSSSPLDGAAGMAFFWLGTLPAMAGLSLAGPLFARFGGRWWPRAALTMMVVLGGLTMYRGFTAAGPGCPHCAM